MLKAIIVNLIIPQIKRSKTYTKNGSKPQSIKITEL